MILVLKVMESRWGLDFQKPGEATGEDADLVAVEDPGWKGSLTWEIEGWHHEEAIGESAAQL